MKHKYLIFFILLLFYSCKKDNSTNIICETNPSTPDANEISKGKTLDNGGLLIDCVSSENIISYETEFVMLNKGLQENGIAKGIKINKTWEASAFVSLYDSVFNISILTYWYDTLQNYYLAGDLISFISIPINDTPLGCYDLTSELFSSTNLIGCDYRMKHGDISLIDYTLDESKENKLEIIAFDAVNKIVKGKFKASFTTDEPEPGYFPEEVRFFNVDFETY